MNEMALVAIVIVLIVVVCLSRRRSRQMDIPLQRLYPGVVNKAEWMASETVVHSIEADYLSAQAWIVDALLCDYMAYLRDLPHYFQGDCLRDQERLAKLQMRKRGPRLIGILRANHRVQVRRFSDDGQTCYLLDHQTERRMATYDYWSKRRLHTQDLGEGVYVYRIVHDRATHHWKIDQLVQQLPLGWDTFPLSNPAIRLMDELPIAAGRDV